MESFRKFFEDESDDFVGADNLRLTGDQNDLYSRYIAGMDKNPLDPHRSRRITKQEREQILSLAKQGMNANEIGFHVDVPVHVIKGLLKRNKLGPAPIGRTIDDQHPFPSRNDGEENGPFPGIDALRQQGEEEEMMNRRGQWDKPIDIDDDPELANNIDINSIDLMKTQLILRYYMGDTPEYHNAIRRMNTNDLKELIRNIKSQQVGPASRTLGTRTSSRATTANNVELAVNRMIQKHLNNLKPTTMQKIMSILQSTGKTFKDIYQDIVNTFTTQGSPNPGPHPGDWEGYHRSKELDKPLPTTLDAQGNPVVKNPYKEKKQQTSWDQLKRIFGRRLK